MVQPANQTNRTVQLFFFSTLKRRLFYASPIFNLQSIPLSVWSHRHAPRASTPTVSRPRCDTSSPRQYRLEAPPSVDSCKSPSSRHDHPLCKAPSPTLPQLSKTPILPFSQPTINFPRVIPIPSSGSSWKVKFFMFYI